MVCGPLASRFAKGYADLDLERLWLRSVGRLSFMSLVITSCYLTGKSQELCVPNAHQPTSNRFVSVEP